MLRSCQDSNLDERSLRSLHKIRCNLLTEIIKINNI